MTAQRKLRVGLALGSGSARGWAHIGVIRALEEAGVCPDLVCGTSIGALVGAAYAAGELERLESWVLGLQIGDVVGFADVSLSAGLLKGDRLMQFFRNHFVDRPLEHLQVPFAAVATSLQTGEEVWLRSGSTLDAVRASIALPGIFTPVRREGLLLVDGGLANPIPVSLARAMGADIVIAVDLGSDILGRRFRTVEAPEATPSQPPWMLRLREHISSLSPEPSREEPPMPSMMDVLSTSMDIVQVKIARSRLAGDPPEVLVTPQLARLRLFDFHRAKEAIEEGRLAVHRVAHSLAVLNDEAT
ncbi:patatin-like phospholipase RssA [Hydrogenophaga sp.]|uniref:patatin-like phospholipase RssA n=1 Tax=Hydrogenophaga sp. TaxID=1904254 RepID=UPI002726D27C|nr:patatin-like phospholipase RssA [Hydrogenophaga sp.]MDO8905494.1 patatin-like phospholipase RssA [Hydrogenophaga sp.]